VETWSEDEGRNWVFAETSQACLEAKGICLLRKNGLFSEWILSSSGEKSLKMLLHPAPSFLPSSYAPLPQLLWSSNQNPKEKERYFIIS